MVAFHVKFRNMPVKGQPPADQNQNVYNVSGHVENGWTIVRFSRALDTGDAADDFIFDGQQCAYFLYAWGGSVEVGDVITFHTNYEVSSEHYCFTACGVQTPLATTNLPPGTLLFSRVVGFSFKLADDWKEEYGNTSSLEYLRLKNRVVSLVSLPLLFLQ